ncbi:hypothetical protein P0136_03345 [Lentisphaerota bacterium ZTH]|nr:hypothetical protein JYG24_05525 [Lentisphaerota bacterium]WET07036.1 hypothetical protein P0136_03345 [Lentisphaerota bacterium ZTH]
MIKYLKNATVNSFLKDFLFLAIFCFLLYSSAIFIPFLQHDGYRYISTPITQCKWLIMLGRPLAAIVEFLQGVIITYSTNHYFLAAGILRGILVLIMAFTAGIASQALRKIVNNKYLCLGIVCSIITLPGFIGFVATVNISNIMAILFAGLSYIFLELCSEDRFGAGRKKLLFAAALISIYISLLLYPILSFLFLIPTMLRIMNGIGRNEYKFLKFFFRDFVFLGINSLVAYAVFRLLFTVNIVGYDNSIKFMQVIDSLHKLFSSDYLMAASLWNIYNSKMTAGFVLLLIAALTVGIFIKISAANKCRRLSIYINTFVRAGAVFAIFFVLNFHLILFKIILVNRMFLNYSIFLLLIITVLAVKINRKFGVIIYLFAVAGSLSALYISSQNALNAYTEFNYAAARLYHSYSRQTKGVHFIISKTPDTGFNRLPSEGDSFNIDTTSTGHVDIKKFSRALFMYLGLPLDLKYSFSYCGQLVRPRRDVTVINMNDIVYRAPMTKRDTAYKTIPGIQTVWKKAFEPLDRKKITGK